MASWFEKVASQATKQRRWKRQRQMLAVEDGQSCPRCGDLWSWNLTRCKACGAKLT
jgi:hypothetical protein